MPLMNTFRPGPRAFYRQTRGTAVLSLGFILLSLGILLKASNYESGTSPFSQRSALASSIFGRSKLAPDEAEAQVDTIICSNTCRYSRDGICQEGRAGFNRSEDSNKPYQVLCDLGTDCDDCGAFHYVGPRKNLDWHPVADLTGQNVELFVRKTATPKPFWMPYTNHTLDTDVSAQMHDIALIEPGITWVWHKLLSAGCSEGATVKVQSGGSGSSGGLVLDVGANFGYYSLFAAAMGCRAIAWEPVPKFSAFFKYALLRNQFLDRIEIRERAVGAEDGKEMTLVVPKFGIWGTAGVGGLTINAEQAANGTSVVVSVSERLDTAVPLLRKESEKILIMKIDVEGFEPEVLRSAKKLVESGMVRNIIMEYSPGAAEFKPDWALAEENPAKLLALKREGYKILHLNESLRVLRDFEWDGELPDMLEVKEESLKFDLEDVKRVQAGTLGCPLPAEIEAEQFWDCRHRSGQPLFEFERLNPKGFRSTFGYNTNLWLSQDNTKDSAALPAASLIDPGSDKDWFVPGEYSYPIYPGNELRKCSNVPPEFQVKFRCHCTDVEVCGGTEALVTAAAERGDMPPVPLTGLERINFEQYRASNW